MKPDRLKVAEMSPPTSVTLPAAIVVAVSVRGFAPPVSTAIEMKDAGLLSV